MLRILAAMAWEPAPPGSLPHLTVQPLCKRHFAFAAELVDVICRL